MAREDAGPSSTNKHKASIVSNRRSSYMLSTSSAIALVRLFFILALMPMAVVFLPLLRIQLDHGIDAHDCHAGLDGALELPYL